MQVVTIKLDEIICQAENVNEYRTLSRVVRKILERSTRLKIANLQRKERDQLRELDDYASYGKRETYTLNQEDYDRFRHEPPVTMVGSSAENQ